MKPRIALLLLASCGAPGRSAPEPAAPSAQPGPDGTDASVASASTSASPTPATPSAPVGDAPTPIAGGSVLIGEIGGPKAFSPRQTLDRLVPDMLSCYRRVREGTPSLHGKLKLRVLVNEAGAAQSVAAEPGGAANDPALVSCLAEVIKGATFPKPGGTAIVIVPLVFRP